jgi:peptide/nickel transport system substrate-binding protein
VVKNRGALVTLFGMFNMRKAASPWREVRLRQAVNYAINRADLIHYAAKGNGVVIPALVPFRGFGYDPDLTPYPFDPSKARSLLREAGHPDGLAITLIASQDLQIQATVVSKMLEQAGFTVDLRVLDAVTFNQKTLLSHLDRPPEQQLWDIALTSWGDTLNFPVLMVYHFFALDGPHDWLSEQPALRRLREQVLQTVERQQQEQLIRQMERHIHDHASFLFLYNPIELYAVNREVEFVPYVTDRLILAETFVKEPHWSVRKQKAGTQE